MEEPAWRRVITQHVDREIETSFLHFLPAMAIGQVCASLNVRRDRRGVLKRLRGLLRV